MASPKLGTYVSEGEQFKIEIKSADPQKGQIKATYSAANSPEGPFEVDCDGGYAWVKAEAAPFNIRFTAGYRPGGHDYKKWHFCIYDTWTGIYQAGDKLLMDGSRSYVSDKDERLVKSLGELVFSHSE